MTAAAALSSVTRLVAQAQPAPTSSTPSPTDTSAPLVHPHINYNALLPELIMIGGALLVLLRLRAAASRGGGALLVLLRQLGDCREGRGP